MTLFVDEVAKRLAEHWVRLIVLPGLLYVALVALVRPVSPWRAGRGAGDALDFSAVRGGVPTEVGAVTGVGLVAVAVVVLLASLLAGQAVAALAGLVERVWLGVWPRWIAMGPTAVRRWRWGRRSRLIDELLEKGQDRLDVRGLIAARVRLAAICLVEPQRPTWMGDRMAAVETVLDGAYHLPLRDCWPRLWLVLPDRVRDDVRTASQAFHQQTLLSGWGVLYTVTAVYWWPAGVVGAVLLVTAWRRGRVGLDQFAELVEASVDLHAADLARALGLTVESPLTPELGERIRVLLVKTE